MWSVLMQLIRRIAREEATAKWHNDAGDGNLKIMENAVVKYSQLCDPEKYTVTAQELSEKDKPGSLDLNI